MALYFYGGDYTPSPAGDFRVATPTEALLQGLLFQLTARRGACPLCPNFGSELYRIPQEKPANRAQRAKEYVETCLGEQEGLLLEDVIWDEETATVTVAVQVLGESLALQVPL